MGYPPADSPPPPPPWPRPAGFPSQAPPWQPPPVPGYPPVPQPTYAGVAPPPHRPRRGSVWPLVVAGIAGVVVLALVATVAAVVLRGGGTPVAWRDPVVEQATEDLSAAAATLSQSPATRFTGSFTDDDGDTVTVDASLTNEGSTLATLTVGGTSAELLSTGESAFVKADAAFWQQHGAPPENVTDYGTVWVKVPPDFFGVDLGLVLAPSLLAEAIAPAIAEDAAAPPARAVPGPVTTVNGVEAQAVSANGLTVHITTAEPKRIVRIATSSATPTPSVTGSSLRTASAQRHPGWRANPVLSPVGVDDLQLDLAELPADQVSTFFQVLAQRIQQLRSAVDSQVRFSLSGAITLAPCGTTGCQANLTIRNKVQSTSRYLQVNKPVRASIVISMTLDGRPVRTCVQDRTMPPNGTASVSCFAAYYIPPSRNPRVHTVRAVARAVARALIDADIQKLAEDLVDELARNPVKRPRVTPSEPEPTPEPGGAGDPPCEDPPNGDTAGGPGEWDEVNRGDYDALWKRYQEQITGVKRNHEYMYNGVEYDGFRVEDGRYVFIVAKSRFYAGAFKAATFDANGNLVVPRGSFAERILNERIDQLRRQLTGVLRHSGARLRYVMAEKDALDKLKAYAKQQLSADEFDRIDWEHEDNDFTFDGCE